MTFSLPLPLLKLPNTANYGCAQPPPQALRFSQGRGERLVMNRKGPWEGYRRSRLPLRAHFHRERDVWVRGSAVHILGYIHDSLNTVMNIIKVHDLFPYIGR